jgi:acyl-[acyl-carrier-protein]-phospholipid O-acyltransferase/long-chain-fatty-acid--[acyl-carrier-protein] ligase
VELSQYNVASNVEATDAMYDLRRSDGILGGLPFGDAFGCTLTLWLVLITNARGVYHAWPADRAGLGRMTGEHRPTILIATRAMLRDCVEQAEPQDLASFELVLAAGEQPESDLLAAFEAKFGTALTLVYGAPELSPLAAANIPPHRAGGRLEKASKPGTVGRAIPGVSARVIDPQTGADLGTNRSGELLIRGPNVMRSYLDSAEKSGDVVRDGWFHTGETARIDDEGFIEIIATPQASDSGSSEPVGSSAQPVGTA